MKLRQWIRLVVIGSSIVTLAACSSMHRNRDGSAINEANSSYDSGAQTSGVNDEAGFGDQAGGAGGQVASKRVYYFDYDSNAVRQNDMPAIAANAKYVDSHNGSKVMLEGHTDPRGSREYNIGLGERRAKSVAEVMTSKGVNPDQIRVVSYGAEKLAANGHTDEDYQLDRRSVLVYLQR